MARIAARLRLPVPSRANRFYVNLRQPAFDCNKRHQLLRNWLTITLFSHRALLQYLSSLGWEHIKQGLTYFKFRFLRQPQLTRKITAPEKSRTLSP